MADLCYSPTLSRLVSLETPFAHTTIVEALRHKAASLLLHYSAPLTNMGVQFSVSRVSEQIYGSA